MEADHALFRRLVVLCPSAGSMLATPPPNATREAFTTDWCDCGCGTANLTLWPAGNRSAAVALSVGGRDAGGLFGWIDWGAPVREVEWVCDGMGDVQRSALVAAFRIVREIATQEAASVAE